MSYDKTLKIGVAGLGTVGAHVCKILIENRDLISKRAGADIVLHAVSSRDKTKDRGFDSEGLVWVDNAVALADIAELDIIIEAIGGEEGIALDLAKASLSNKISFVTANKAMIAHHGAMLVNLAEENGVSLAFEAAVAGGIPILKTLREGLSANQISAVYGILNGTCNYILTEMTQTGRDFEDVLKEAQDLGYAEADPSFDVDGVDAAHKLSILSALAFAGTPDFENVSLKGIRDITALDIDAAQELGYRIKLLGMAKKTERGVEQSVEPCLVPLSEPIATIEGSLNAVYVEGDFVGESLSVGHGAGGGPTASAVVADIIDISRGHVIHPFSMMADTLSPLSIADISQRKGAYYIRLVVLDQPGVIADIAAILRDCDVSLQSVLQHGHNPDQPVTVILTTHPSFEANMQKALHQIHDIEAVVETPYQLRIEDFKTAI